MNRPAWIPLALAGLLGWLALGSPLGRRPGARTPEQRSGADALRVVAGRVQRLAAADPALPLRTAWQDPRLRLPQPSPDGRRLAWRGLEGSVYGLFLAEGAEAKPRMLEACRNAFQPSWSPDSTRILFSAMDWQSGERQLCVYDLKAGACRRLFRSSGGLGALAAWTPDGRKIVFRYRGDLWLMNADGIGCSQLGLRQALGRELGEPALFAFSPDGRRLGFQERGVDVFLVVELAPKD